MMFTRKIYEDMLDWKKKVKGKKALLIEGAPQVGKTTTVKEFAEKEYKSAILIDFREMNPIVIQAFIEYLEDLDTFFFVLSTEFHTTLYPRKSVIIFDGVQYFPEARLALKTLVKDGRFDYMETGTLLSVSSADENMDFLPEEQVLKMHPLDFAEFCYAFGEEKLVEYIENCFYEKKPLMEKFHKKAMMLFLQYMIVGGMPKPLSIYLENNRDFALVDAEKRAILNLYLEEIAAAKATYRKKVNSIFTQIPSFLSKHEKRVRFSSVSGRATQSYFEKAFYWLHDAMICNECFHLSMVENRGFVVDYETVKCYLGDTGLLFSQTYNEEELESGEIYRNILHERLSLRSGMFFENAIAQNLVSNGYDLFFFTEYDARQHRNDIEIDFLISSSSKTKRKVYPIEVKPCKKYTTNSLDKFMNLHSDKVGNGIVIHTKNFEIKGNIAYIPCYMTFCL